MKGVIAAGSQPTAEAGAQILAEGGNAVDAAVGACFAVAAGEPTITSLAGGGMMIIRSGQTGEVQVHDFFGNAPIRSQADHPNLDFHSIDLSYGPTTQSFYVGAGSAGVPGVIPGLCTALENFGSWTLSDVIQPACQVLRNGAVLGPKQAELAVFLEPILTSTPSGRKIFAPHGRYLRAGDRFKLPILAETLESMASAGWSRFYRDSVQTQLIKQFGPESGGLLTQADFDNYQVRNHAPLMIRSGQSEVLTIPPPAAGGPMIALMRILLRSIDSAHTSRELGLCAAMATADAARLTNRLAPSEANELWWRRDFSERLDGPLFVPKMPGGPPSTTHISVVDRQGNAVGVTFSHGESNASAIEGTGIMMNNFLGEEDLLPHGLGTATTGERLATMMSPTLVTKDDGSLFVLGTGGSNRIRTAILQVIGRILDEDTDPASAVRAPRLHFEDGVLTAETFGSADIDSLTRLDTSAFVPFPEPHLFFGGVNVAALNADGTLDGGADPRRGGHCIIV